MTGRRKIRMRMRRAFTENSLAIIAIGFAVLILIGTLLLSLPVSSRTKHSIGGFDALFTATSAVCVTGLVVRDTGTTFSQFGQWVLLALIQIGGLGFMTFSTMFYKMLRIQLRLRDRLVLQESLNEDSAGGLRELVRWVITMTFTVEAVGAAFLALKFVPRYGTSRGVFYAIFHAVSAFCNAGFDLIGRGASLTAYRTDWLMNFIVIALVVFGGLGFAVENDVYQRLRDGRKHRLTLQTRVVLSSYMILMAISFVFNLSMEWGNPATLGNMRVPEKFLAAFFQSVTLRTAGFNTIDQAALHPATKMINCIFMLIGAAPASTGGGIKVTTVALIWMLVKSIATGNNRIVVYHRTVDRALVDRAVTIIVLALAIVLTDVVCISLMQPEMDIMDIAYECFSAMGTVGISAVGTSRMGIVSRIMIIITMYLGRIGPITMALLLAHRQKTEKPKVIYPNDRFMIG